MPNAPHAYGVDDALETVLRLKLNRKETWPQDLITGVSGTMEAKKKISMAGPGGAKQTQKGPSQNPNPKRAYSAQTPTPEMWEAIRSMFAGM